MAKAKMIFSPEHCKRISEARRGKSCLPVHILEKIDDVEWLKSQYVDYGKSTKEIAKELGISHEPIRKRLVLHHLIRTPAEGNSFSYIPAETQRLLRDSSWLFDQYINQRKSAVQIGKENGVSNLTVLRHIRKCGIARRDAGIYHHNRRISASVREKIDDMEWLRREYIDNKRNCSDIGRELGITSGVIIDQLNAFGIALRSKSEETSKDKNPRWLGGISFDPYCPKFDRAFKERVRDKFGRRCFLCGSPENRERLCVHHIDYAKNSICNGKEWAFVPLCHRQHAQTNSRRWYWFNLLICYWAMNPEINFKAVELRCW